MKKLTTCLVLLFLGTLHLMAQNGDRFFTAKDYRSAVIAYEKEVKTTPEKYFKLAQSHFALLDFDNAIECLENYKTKYDKADKPMADQWLALLRREDDKVTVKNITSPVNSGVSDYFPRVSSDGKTLYFTSHTRDGGSGGEDVWYSNKTAEGIWDSPKPFYQFNTASHECIMSISPDGNVAILFGNYNGSFGRGDLFYSVRTANGWSSPCNLGGKINTKDWETQATIGGDGKTMLFVSDRPGGQGGSDIYMTQLTDKGWTNPINLGPKVNTGNAEYYPALSADGKTLYFSTNGRGGFGGQDLFVCKRLDDSWTNWSEPLNMGKYINTLNDDQDLSLPSSGTKAYMVREDAPEGLGGSDIYEFVIPFNMRPEQVFNVAGRVYDEKDSSVEAIIRFFDFDTDKEVSKSTSNGADGKYFTTLPKNKKYKVVIDMKGYLYFSSILDLSDPDLYKRKQTIRQKIGNQYSRLATLKSKMDELGNQLNVLLESNSENLKQAFADYEKLSREYKKASDELDLLVSEAKYEWMAEEDADLTLERDFKLQTVSIGATFELKNIFFDFGKSTLRKESETELDKLFDILRNSEISIELGGHSDSIGSDDANEKLSQERVNSVRQYLVNKGIQAERLTAVGYGEKQPIASNATETGRQMNRRVEVKILKLTFDREGGEVVKEEDKKKKKEPVVEKAPERADMLQLLQAAAKNGGLPSGSNCNETVTYSTRNDTYDPNKKTRKNYTTNGDEISREEYILKSFNASLVNFRYKSLNSGSLGVQINFVNKKLRETSFEYYFSNPDSIKLGIGFNRIQLIQLKEVINLPLNIVYGLETKLFLGRPFGETEDKLFGNLNIPLGFRYIFPEKAGVILGPEAIYSLGVWKYKPLPANTGHLRLGLNARWKMFHAGAYYNIGKEVGFFGFRAGVSF